MKRLPITHFLKIWPVYFEGVITGKKTFEYRLNDRGFLVGDHLVLQEWDPLTKTYSGRLIKCYVPFLLDCGDGFVIMSIWRECDVTQSIK